jgi:hypothetical protein
MTARERLEPDALVAIERDDSRNYPSEREVEQSKAISLKRLADAAERIADAIEVAAMAGAEEEEEAPPWWKILGLQGPNYRGQPWAVSTVEAHWRMAINANAPEDHPAIDDARAEGLREAGA